MCFVNSPSPSDSLSARATRIAELTRELCAISSVTGDEDEISRWLSNWFKRLPDYELCRVGHSFALRPTWTGRPVIALVGHTDTVPPHPNEAAPKVKNGRVTGLGSSDMKGGLAVMMALMEDLNPATLPYDLVFVFYDAEEGPFANSGLGPLLDGVDWLSEVDLAFCLEPSDNVVQVGCVGTLHANVVFEGRSSHSARPWQGENAIHKAGDFLTTLAAREPVDVDVFGYRFREVISATLAEGGRARNVIPETFSLNVNYRFAPGKSLEDAQQEVLDLVNGQARVVFTDLSPSGRVVADNLLFQKFLTHTQVEVTAKQAWTDVARLAVVGIDAVNFGPGLSAQAHQAREYAEIHLLDAAYEIFHDFLGAR
jgi:succinyl-diaminopimelate desuccinylase